MTWLLSIVGGLLVALALRDIFHTLWHPGGFGGLSHLVFRLTWRVMKVRSHGSRVTGIAGPLGLLLTLAAWTLLLVVGFALIYLPRMPQDFTFGSSLHPQESSDVLASVYLSAVALTTLGLGDILPSTPILRLLVPTEALLGFVLLTAGISWILQLYPALNRRRTLARRLSTMARHGVGDVIETGEPSIAVQHLEAVRGELAAVEVDLMQYAESYYFAETEGDVSLAASLPCVLELVAAGRRSSSFEVRNAAALLADGLGEFTTLLQRGFLDDGDTIEATLRAFADDHQHSVPGMPGPGAWSGDAGVPPR